MANITDSASFSMEGVSRDQLGPHLAKWLTAIDQAFLAADDEEKIFGHVAALVSVMAALKHIPGFRCEMRTLADLLERLDRYSSGQKEPINRLAVKPKSKGRAPISETEELTEIRAVCLVQIAVERGIGPSEATHLVATEMTKQGHRGRSGGVLTARTVEHWWSEKYRASDERYIAMMQNHRQLIPLGCSPADMQKLIRFMCEKRPSIFHPARKPDDS